MIAEAPGTGDLVHDRYRLGRLIGRGGMARVFEARDERLGRPVALKVLGGASESDAERFAAEVATLARLDHPNIVRLLDAGELGSGLAYLVMELVAGTSLGARLRSGPLGADEVARIGAAVAAGLAYVHESGVVHRDVKPGNILLGPDERVRLADFGIARLVDTGGLTVPGVVLGTPAYLSPEQVTGRAVGPATDLYALGLVLAECATGRRVFDGPAAEVTAARLHAAPLALDEVPEALRVVLTRLTDPNPAARPPASEVAARLAPVAGAKTTPAPARVPLPDAPLPSGAGETPPGEATVPLTISPTLVRPAAPRQAPWRNASVLLVGAVLACFGAGFAVSAAVPGGSAPAALSTPHTPRAASATTRSSASSPLHRAAAAFDGALRSGAQAGRIDAAAHGRLARDLRQLLSDPGRRRALLAQLGTDLSRALSARAVTGTSATALPAALDALAGAVGVAVPRVTVLPTTTLPATTRPATTLHPTTVPSTTLPTTTRPRPTGPTTTGQTTTGATTAGTAPPSAYLPPGHGGAPRGRGHDG